MRLLRVYIDGYRNLKNVEVNFDKESLTTVVIGENGSGKSNLIEAIVEVFRAFDLGVKRITKFKFKIEYEIRGLTIKLNNIDQKDGALMCATVQKGAASYGVGSNAMEHLPDLIFGYYSGSSRRFESLFDDHQKAYYKDIIKDDDKLDFEKARRDRRLFFCRPIHGTFALLSQFVFPTPAVKKELAERLKITDFHSALAHFKQPSWFKYDRWRRKKAKDQNVGQRGRASHADILQYADDHWLANGPAGECIGNLRKQSFFPMTITGKVVDDYRQNPKEEGQLACFLRDKNALESLKKAYADDSELFAALEAADISDLFRDMIVWVTRKNDDSGDISFSDLSDGERQLLMVLGLIRVSRGKEALFLLDEPDTHLNPAWQLTYLDLIREWTEVAADEDKCQIIMTSHNPLTIAALTKKEVRVMQTAEDGQVKVSEPYADPRGMGFTSTLTEIFGLPSTLDPETQKQIDDRNVLAQIDKRSEKQERMLIELNDKLNRLGFMNESREPLYQDFLKAWQDVRYADKPPLTPDQIEARHKAMQSLIKQLSEGKETAH